jgi:predicted ATPase/class 3 adenylate cyclase
VSGREVRKTVTILFCDLVHSTGLAAGDPEAYRRVQTRFFDAMRAIVERHGGTVEKFIGDEVMAVFGVPVAHEDDALRAVRAAEEMQAALPELGLEGRIGINTGEVLAGDPEQGGSFVAGEPVILAKRLEQAAESGEILIGKATYPLVKHAISGGPLERIPVKGKRDEIGRRRVDEIDHEAPGVARRLHAPIVGRDDELELLSQAFERTVEERSCRLFTVLGPAGIGKSRLAAELCTRVGERATTATGRCLSYGEGITYWPLAEALRDLGGEEAVQDALEDGDEDETVLELLRGVTGASESPGSSEETFWAVRRALEALARRRPLVLCLEDLHWAEPTLLDLVEYVAGWSRSAPILLLILARPELVERRPTWIAPQANADALALEPLSKNEMQALLAELGSEIELARGVKDRIAEAAEGNPLFVEQMAAMAAEQNGHGELAVPPSIQALVAERLDRLTATERDVIERAAVVGRDFPASAVSVLCPKTDRPSLSRHLLALVRKGLIRPDPAPSDREDRFSFQHVVLRDCAYEAMPKELRATLHERLADWVEESRGDRTLQALIGYHLEQAHRFRTEIGPPDLRSETLAHRAGEALAAAGRHALAGDDIPASVNLLRRASGLLAGHAGKRAEVLVDLAVALREGGDLAEADATLAEVVERSAVAGREDVRLRACVERSSLHSFVDPLAKTDEMLRVANEAIAFFEGTGDDLGLAKALIHVGEAQWMRCRCAEMEATLERALVHAERAGAQREASWTLGSLMRAAVMGPRAVEDAIQRCLSMRERGRRGPVPEAYANSALAILEAMRGQAEEARALYAESKTTLEDVGHTLLLASLQMYGGIAELIAGDYQAAERELRLGCERLEAMGETAQLSTMAAFLSRALYRVGNYREADAATRTSEAAASPDDIASQMIWRGTRAKLLALRGESAAEPLAAEAVALSRETDFTNWQADALVDLAETLRILGRGGEATPLLEEALALYEAKGNVASAAAVRQTGRPT